MADEPLLDLKTVTGKFHVRIDGVPHFIAHPDALTLSQMGQLDRLGPRVFQLIAKASEDTLPADEERELAAYLDRFVRIVLDAPNSVHEKLMDSHRADIVTAFFRLRSPGRATGATTEASRSIGAKRSRGSRPSTVAIRKAG